MAYIHGKLDHSSIMIGAETSQYDNEKSYRSKSLYRVGINMFICVCLFVCFMLLI